jgi:addiction module HigA family antidote
MDPLSPTARTDPPRPGAVLLQEFMQPLGLTGYRVAKELSLAPITVSEILRGLRSISPTVACRLGRYFGVPAAYWLTLQASYDAHIASNNGAADGVEVCDLLQNDAKLHEKLKFTIPPGLFHHDAENKASKAHAVAIGRDGGNGALPKNGDQAVRSNGKSITPTDGKRATLKGKFKTPSVRNEEDLDPAPIDGMKTDRKGRV